MKRTITIAPVRKSIRVGAGQAHAFDVFTSGLAHPCSGSRRSGVPSDADIGADDGRVCYEHFRF